MLVGTHRKYRFSPAMLLGMVGLLCVVGFLVVGCGSATPADQPLTTTTASSVATGAASVTAAAGVVPISVVDALTSLSSYPGGGLQLAITTSPYAICTLVVSYGQATPSKAPGILPHTADAAGKVQWNWQIDTTAHTGTWPLTVTALLPDGAKTTTTVNVTITFVPISVITGRTNLTALPKQDMMLTIQTGPSVNCTIVLNFGATVAGRTVIHKVGQDGITSFTWKIDRATVPGVYTIPVTITLGDGEQSSINVDMTVLKH